MIGGTRIDELEEVFELIQACADDMKSKDVHQWDDTYPTLDLVKQDIESDSMYSFRQDAELKAIISMDENQSSQYDQVNWKFTEAPILVIHRLAVSPDIQGKGLGKLMMGFAEAFAKDKGYQSIRLDAYKFNEVTIRFYEKLGYSAVGEIPLEYTAGPFVCFEKRLD